MKSEVNDVYVAVNSCILFIIFRLNNICITFQIS